MHVPGSLHGALRRRPLPVSLPALPALPAWRLTRPVAGGFAVLLALVLLLTLVLLYSPVAHPSRVYVTGVTGPSQARIERALREAGAGQSTLHVDRDAILSAVRAFPEVADVRINASPPSGLTLTAVMRLPVGVATVAGRRMVVAGDGRVLERISSTDLPEIDPSAGALQLRGAQLAGAAPALEVLAAAPHALLPLAKGVRMTQAGLEVTMRRGPRLIFGTARDARAKWVAAATVIADGAAAAASYVDVRVPSRPAVGGIGGSRVASELAPPTLTASTPATAIAPARPAATTPATSSPVAAAPTASAGVATGAAATGATTTGRTSTPSAGGTTQRSTGAASPQPSGSPVVGGGGSGAGGGAALAPGQ